MSFFKPSEFNCNCSRPECDAPRIPHPELLRRLNDARGLFGAPIIVTSGNRCAVHNKAVGGEPNSEHVWPDGCLGADLLVTSSRARFRLRRALLMAGFTRIGTYRRHLHAGVGDLIASTTFPTEVEWYS